MTYKQYKSLRTHWSVLDEAQRSIDRRAKFFDILDLIGRIRRLDKSDSSLYQFFRNYLKTL